MTETYEEYYKYYAELEQQRWMVADHVRTDAFAEAIAEVVKPGDVVIDVGAGTGLLSLLAAKAGARKVIAVERSEMAVFAKDLVKENGFEDKIEVFHGEAEKLELEEKADVIVSEWLGHMAFVEGMFRSVIKVRDAWLKPGGKLLPANVSLKLAPIDDQELYVDHGPGFWSKKTIHGIDFSSFTQKELNMGHVNRNLIPQKYLLALGTCIKNLETIDAQSGDEWTKGIVEFEIERDGALNGFVGWFSSQLSAKVLLDTAPNCLRTHWEQTHFPFQPMQVKKGQTLKLEYHLEESYTNKRLMDMTLKVGDREINYTVD